MSDSTRSGQASIELLAAVPLLILITLALWQAVLAVRTAALAATAARSGARAAALGADPGKAVGERLPVPERGRARVVRLADGTVTVRLAVPAVFGAGRLGDLASSARFEGQR